MATLQPFAKRMRAFRKQRKLSQALVAKRAGVSNITISKIESGDNDNPTIQTLQRVAKVLKVTVIDLLK